VIRVAAAGDLHFGPDSAGLFRPHLEGLGDEADVLLLAGDLTKTGEPGEAAVLAEELRQAPIPVVAVLGNHDYHADREGRVRERMERAGVQVLEGEATVVEVGELRLGIAGTKGFGGGFVGASGSDFGEPQMKAFVRCARDMAIGLGEALASVRADVRVALLHYAPVRDTLVGEPLEIYPFLGSYLLAEAIDREGAELVLHGHAHRGTEKGVTPRGIHVRNVAQSVINRPYNVYRLDALRVADPAGQQAMKGPPL
jgi:Icc-related predicted phosphoesterase